MPTISINSISFHYSNSTQVFKNLTLKLGTSDNLEPKQRGNVVVVMGSSGSGKTTLLRLLARLEKPIAGTITVTPELPLISYLSQDPVLFEHLSRKENARYFQHLAGLKKYFDEAVFTNAGERLKLLSELESSSSVIEMSGGERQRLALLRALSIRPQILLLDEPCTGLDVPVKQEFLRMLRELVDEYKPLVIYVTHHPDEARLIADEILYISRDNTNGNSVASAITHLTLSDFLNTPPTLEAAQFFASPALNVLVCTFEDGYLKLEHSNKVIGKCLAPKLQCGKYTIAFPPESLNWNDTSGVEAVCTGESDQFVFLRVMDGEVARHLIGLRIGHQMTRISLRGRASVFDHVGEHLQSIIIERLTT